MSQRTNLATKWRAIRDTILNVTEIESKVREATSNELWGAPSTLMGEIAEASRNREDLHLIMRAIWQRIAENSGKKWRCVYKSLLLLEYLVRNGSDRVVEDARDHIHALRTLQDFQYVDLTTRKDEGINVREKSKFICDFISDQQRINEERQKAQSMKSRIISISSTDPAMQTGIHAGSFQPYIPRSAERSAEVSSEEDESDEEQEEKVVVKVTKPLPKPQSKALPRQPPSAPKRPSGGNLVDVDAPVAPTTTIRAFDPQPLEKTTSNADLVSTLETPGPTGASMFFDPRAPPPSMPPADVAMDTAWTAFPSDSVEFTAPVAARENAAPLPTQPPLVPLHPGEQNLFKDKVEDEFTPWEGSASVKESKLASALKSSKIVNIDDIMVKKEEPKKAETLKSPSKGVPLASMTTTATKSASGRGTGLGIMAPTSQPKPAALPPYMPQGGMGGASMATMSGPPMGMGMGMGVPRGAMTMGQGGMMMMPPPAGGFGLQGQGSMGGPWGRP